MLRLNNCTFRYDERPLIENLNLTLEPNSIISIIGESGCGKSSLLKLIYGLYDLIEGEIWFENSQVLGPKHHLIAGMPFMKYLAQDFDLMPFTTVAENVGSYLSNFYPKEKNDRISELLEVVEMTDYRDVKVKRLSGGQMQRVAIAKVLAKEPQLLLLDEPFSHIDNFRKNALRRKLFSYLKKKGIMTIIATHDSTDVLSYSDRVIVMKNGGIIADESPEVLYHHPGSYYIASLLDEVNEFQWGKEVKLVYAHQLKWVTQSDFHVQVQASFFQGDRYLIEAHSDLFGKVYFNHDSAIIQGTIGCLDLNEL